MKLGASTEASSVVRTEFRHTSIRTKLERSGILLLLVAMGAVFTWREPAFLSVDNLFSHLAGRIDCRASGRRRQHYASGGWLRFVGRQHGRNGADGRELRAGCVAWQRASPLLRRALR